MSISGGGDFEALSEGDGLDADVRETMHEGVRGAGIDEYEVAAE